MSVSLPIFAPEKWCRLAMQGVPHDILWRSIKDYDMTL